MSARSAQADFYDILLLTPFCCLLALRHIAFFFFFRQPFSPCRRRCLIYIRRRAALYSLPDAAMLIV